MKLFKSLLFVGILAITGCSLNVENTPAIPSKVVYNEYNITNTLTENYTENVKSVVTVIERYSSVGGTAEHLATGLIYAKDGTTYYVLTALTNLVHSTDVSVLTYDYQSFSLVQHAVYKPFNIAIFKFTSSAEHHVAKISDTDDLKINDSVYSIGTILSKTLNNSLQTGNISGLNRVASFNDDNDSYSIYTIQTTLLFSEGIHGSPVYNLAGDVIGMLSIFYTSAATQNSASIEGTSFFIPLKNYEHVIASLIDNQSYSKGMLGISGQAQLNVSNSYSTNKGYYAAEVSTTSAAYAAGIRNDSLLTYINGVEIITMSELVRELLKFKTGDSVKVKAKATPSDAEVEYQIILG